jgi:uncharacterized protein involved in exopolysaccharide biosynthesis
MDSTDSNDNLGVRKYAELLWRRKIDVILVTLLFVGGTLAYCIETKAVYQASSHLLLEPNISTTLLQAANTNVGTSTIDVPTDIQVIESSDVAYLVRLYIPNAPFITATQIGTTDVVNVTATSQDPKYAAKLANAYAFAYIHLEQYQTLATFTAAEQSLQKRADTAQLAVQNLDSEIRSAAATTNITGLNTQLTALQNQLNVLLTQLANFEFFASQGGVTNAGQIISQATVPTNEVSPGTIEVTILAGLLGIVLGVGLVLLGEAFRSKVRS